jgi:hypothetical protein
MGVPMRTGVARRIADDAGRSEEAADAWRSTVACVRKPRSILPTPGRAGLQLAGQDTHKNK